MKRTIPSFGINTTEAINGAILVTPAEITSKLLTNTTVIDY
jgi:hypothetical protein